jgi:alkylhydroperoxidase/carboxymuconolactone decarboxylase family protein YurZ
MAESTSETPVLDLLAGMTADSIDASSLDLETLALVRIAALVAVDAPAVSYLLNIGAAGEIGIDPEQVRGVLAAVAPIVGTARVASATTKIAAALEESRSPSSTSKTRTDVGRRHASREARLTGRPTGKEQEWHHKTGGPGGSSSPGS